MADKQVSVTLTGRDNLSPIFQKVGAAATAAGRTIDQAGQSVGNLDKKTTTAAQSMSLFERAANKAEQTTSKLGISGARVGAALGTAVSAGLLLSVRAAAEAEVSQERLRASIEATGVLYEQYAGQIQESANIALSLSFDDEDALDSISALTQATGDAQIAINDLGLVMDIARGRGIDMAAATKIVTAAEQGRYGALQRLGIQIDENASREEALAALQAKYAGQAQAYADTNAGAWDRFTNSVENFAESAGAALGPAQQLLLIFPGLIAGATTAATAFSRMGGASGIAGLLPLLAGPVGLAAAFAGVALAMDKLGEKGDGKTAEEIWADTAKGAEHLRTVLAALASTGAQDLYTLGSAGAASLTQILADLQRWQNLSKSIDAGTTMEDFGLSAVEAQGQMQDLMDTYGSLSASAEDFSSAQNDIAMILADTGIGAKQAQSELADLIAEFEAGTIGPDMFIKDLHTIASSLGDYDVMATKAIGTTFDLSKAFTMASVESVKAAEAQKTALEHVNAQLDITADNYNRMSVEAAKAATVSIAASKQLAEFQNRPMSVEAAQVSTQMPEMSIKVFLDDQAAADKAKKIAEATELMTASFNAATAAATGTTKALDSGFQVVVGNTNAIAQSSQQVADWATELINVQGEYGKMDDLLKQGEDDTRAAVISQEEYNAAQAAYTPIIEANKRIQDDVLSLQTQQAPVLADLAQKQADYMDSLAQATPEAQMFALAMMDSATSAEALQLATGLLSENGDVFVPMIEQAANLDPYLATILQQMGLIEQMPDGTWKVTVDTSQADSAFDNISGAVDELNNTVLLLVALLDDDPFTNTADDVKAKMNEIDGSTATPSVFLNDGASGPLGTIAGLLTSLDGRTVTTYVNTVSTFSGSSISPLGYASGGTISPYGYSRAAANGMTATLVGERGPEVLMLPGGAQVMNTEGSRSRMGGSGGGFTFVNKGTIIGMADLEDKIFESFSKAWQRANQQHERSMGW